MSVIREEEINVTTGKDQSPHKEWLKKWLNYCRPKKRRRISPSRVRPIKTILYSEVDTATSTIIKSGNENNLKNTLKQKKQRKNLWDRLNTILQQKKEQFKKFLQQIRKEIRYLFTRSGMEIENNKKWKKKTRKGAINSDIGTDIINKIKEEALKKLKELEEKKLEEKKLEDYKKDFKKEAGLLKKDCPDSNLFFFTKNQYERTPLPPACPKQPQVKIKKIKALLITDFCDPTKKDRHKKHPYPRLTLSKTRSKSKKSKPF